MTLDEAKEQAVKEFNPAFDYKAVSNGVKVGNIKQRHLEYILEKAAYIYARSKWDEACELTNNRIWNKLSKQLHPDNVNGDSVQMQHIARATSIDNKPEFK